MSTTTLISQSLLTFHSYLSFQDKQDICLLIDRNRMHWFQNGMDELTLFLCLWQASKEKICFTRFDVHGLAVFLPNNNGHFEALNHNCPHYYLSGESIALFQAQSLPSGTPYIVGQIVHIDRKVVNLAPASSSSDGSVHGMELSSTPTTMAAPRARAPYNPFGLALGTEYFVVTVAMVPDL